MRSCVKEPLLDEELIANICNTLGDDVCGTFFTGCGEKISIEMARRFFGP